MAGITTLPKARDVDVLRGPETGANGHTRPGDPGRPEQAGRLG